VELPARGGGDEAIRRVPSLLFGLEGQRTVRAV